MKKDTLYIFALLLGGIGLVIYLNNLPKQVLKEKNRLLEIDTPSSSIEDPLLHNEQGVHKSDSQQQQKIAVLKAKYNAFSNKEKKRIFADSLALSYLILNDFDSSTFFAEQAVLLDNGSLISKNRAANYYYFAFSSEMNKSKRDQYGKKAIAYYKELGSDLNLTSKTRLGVLLTKTQQPPMEGILMLREVVEKDPTHVEALLNLGEFSMITHQYDKAVGRFNSVLESDPTNIKAIIYLGDCLAEMGRREDAKAMYQKGLEVSRTEKFFTSLLTDKINKLTLKK
ncbi:MAG: tetratricopeptide repeat protein [Cyclobacteriaceae bacterium]